MTFIVAEAKKVDKLKSGRKNDTELLNLSSNKIDDSNDKNSFPHKLFCK